MERLEAKLRIHRKGRKPGHLDANLSDPGPEHRFVRKRLVDEIPLVPVLPVDVADTAEELAESNLDTREEPARLNVDLFALDLAVRNPERGPDIEVRIDRAREAQLNLAQTEAARRTVGLDLSAAGTETVCFSQNLADATSSVVVVVEAIGDERDRRIKSIVSTRLTCFASNLKGNKAARVGLADRTGGGAGRNVIQRIGLDRECVSLGVDLLEPRTEPCRFLQSGCRDLLLEVREPDDEPRALVG